MKLAYFKTFTSHISTANVPDLSPHRTSQIAPKTYVEPDNVNSHHRQFYVRDIFLLLNSSHLTSLLQMILTSSQLFFSLNQRHECSPSCIWPCSPKSQGAAAPYLQKKGEPGPKLPFSLFTFQAKRFATLSMAKEESSVGGGLVLLDDDEHVLLVGGKVEFLRFWVSAIMDCCARPAFFQTSANHD